MVVPGTLRFAEPPAVDDDAANAATDAALLRAVAAGDVDAHRRLYERHAAAVFAFLVARTGDRRQAEDVLQEVMIAVWQGASTFRGASAVRSWIIGIAAHKASHALRSVRRERPLPPEADRRGGAEQPARAGKVDDRLDLAAALAALPEEQRTVVVLFFFDGQSLEAIGALLDVPIGTVKSRLHRAKAQLKASLDADAAASGRSADAAPPPVNRASSAEASVAASVRRWKGTGDVR